MKKLLSLILALGMLLALFIFFKKFILTEEKMAEINLELAARHK